MAIIFESIYLGRKIVSLQIKAHDVYIKPLKPRESILKIKESDDEDEKQEESLDYLIEIQIIVLKINQIFKIF